RRGGVLDPARARGTISQGGASSRRNEHDAATLEAEQVAYLHKHAVRRAVHRARKLERRGFAERRAVAGKKNGARDRLVREEDVVAEAIGREGAERGVRGVRRVAPHERRAGARILERRLSLRHVLPDVTQENRARELVFHLQARDVRDRELAAVAHARETVVDPRRVEAKQRRWSPG